MSSGSSASADRKGCDVRVDIDRVLRLAGKIVGLINRRNKGRHGLEDIVNEYWAVRFVVMYYKFVMHDVAFDNEADIVALLNNVLASSTCGRNLG